MNNPTIVILLVGAGFLLIAIVGGGVKINDIIDIRGMLLPWARVVCAFLGLAFLGFGLCRQFPDICPPNCDQVIYEDTVPDNSIHNIRLLGLTAKSCQPPRVNDKLLVEFTLQNVSNKPVNILGVWVTAYDPSGQQKDFAYLSINQSIMPQETIKTSGQRDLDVPGTWDVGPHYALGSDWNNAQYPGHWKSFKIKVEP